MKPSGESQPKSIPSLHGRCDRRLRLLAGSLSLHDRFLADENFDRRIVQALRQSAAHIDVALPQEAGLTGVTDPTLLEWAAANYRILLSHDYKTCLSMPARGSKPVTRCAESC